MKRKFWVILLEIGFLLNLFNSITYAFTIDDSSIIVIPLSFVFAWFCMVTRIYLCNLGTHEWIDTNVIENKKQHYVFVHKTCKFCGKRIVEVYKIIEEIIVDSRKVGVLTIEKA